MIVKVILLQTMILHCGKTSLFWSMIIIFGYLSFTTVRGQKNRFQQLWIYKILNIANFHAFHVWGKRILSCNDTTFILHFFSFCNATFFHSGYVIKPPQPSSTELRLLQATNYWLRYCPAGTSYEWTSPYEFRFHSVSAKFELQFGHQLQTFARNEFFYPM